MSTIHVACAFDKAMATPAAVLASSLKKLAPPGRKTIFHAIECEKNAFPIYAKYLLDSDDFEIRPHKISIEKFKKYDLSIATVRSIATYGRLAIPQLIPGADRVLYVDCDICLLRPIDDLFDTNMQGFPLGACLDLTYLYFLKGDNGPTRASAEALMKNPGSYFNAGILLIDCKKWRERNYLQQLHALLEKPPAPLYFADQDALNAIFQGNYFRLDPRWNSWAIPYTFAEDGEGLAGMADLCARDPWIVHFVGPAKPWIRSHSESVFRALYWKAAKDSPFLAQLVELYNSDLANSAYADPRFPLISANRRIAEFLCTFSRIVSLVENRLTSTAPLSSRLFAIGNKFYNNAITRESQA